MKRIYTYMCLLLLSVLSFAVTGCDDDDDDDVAKDLIELVVNKPVIRIGQNEEAKVNVKWKMENYGARFCNFPFSIINSQLSHCMMIGLRKRKHGES